MILAVAGHRMHRLHGGHARRFGRNPETEIVREIVAENLLKIHPEGLIGGGALGFDITVLTIARELDIPYTIALPYKNHYAAWPEETRRRLLDLSLGASRVIYTSRGRYARAKFVKRNFWMIDHSDCVLANWDGSKTLTGETVAYAWSRRKPVENIWPSFIKRADEILL